MTYPALSRRSSGITESAPLAIDTLAKRYRAEGRPVIAFGAGEPDADTDARIVAAVQAAALKSENHRYTPPLGIPEVREAIAEYTNTYLRARLFTADNVAVTNGGKQAVWNVFSALLDAGDEVILPAPYWTTYPEQISLLQAQAVPVPTLLEDDYKVTVSALRQVHTPRTRALVLTTPSNPTGSVYSAAELTEIGQWAAEVGCWVIADEIYHNFVYDEASFESIARHVPAEQLVIINGVAKSHALTGWRAGWIIAPKRMISVLKNIQSHTTGNVANLSQRAIIAAFNLAQDVPENLRETFDKRRLIAAEIFAQIQGVETRIPQGAFYFFVRVDSLLDGRYVFNGEPVTSSLSLSKFLLEQIDIAAVPGEAFGAPGHLRFSYALATRHLVEGLERFRDFVNR
ncbi:pyridoxal phosphate-dependent aminotransferase [Leucobacter sp. BZR 635]